MEQKPKIISVPPWLGRLLCLIGMHEFRVLEITFAFGPAGAIEKVECTRCGLLTTRRSADRSRM